jgi:hypothetical protein
MGKTASLANIGTIADSSLGFRNRLINSDMRIDQRNAGASVTFTGSGGYTLDRWLFDNTTDGTVTVQQSSTAPTGFSNSCLVTVTAADTSLAATQRCRIRQHIEGFNVADLNWGATAASAGQTAATVTLSFWVRSSLTGTFGGALNNGAADRSYPFTYTISAANTWEQKTVTVAGDTSGTWLTTNGIGLIAQFGLGIGSNFSGTAGAWTGSQIMSTTGATSLIGTNGATFYITGVQLEKGSTATSFDYRPYTTELQLCQRYYYKQKSAGTISIFGSGFNNSTTLGVYLVNFPVALRTEPAALEQSGTASHYQAYYAGSVTVCSAVPSFNAADIWGATVLFTVASGLTTGQASLARSASASAYLAWSAEL